MKPIVAIVGRPNVGKSSFFNAITKSKDAIVDDSPGVTRDRHYGNASWNGADFTLVDTGGFSGKEDEFSKEVKTQIFQAIDDADSIILMMDGKAGITPYDKDMVEILRPLKKPVFYVVNKIDGFEQEAKAYEFYGLGIEKIYSISAEHHYGISDFLDDLTSAFAQASPEQKTDMIKIGVFGRPNVGKSSLINKILGENRLIVSDTPGTTRDAIDTVFKIKSKNYLLIDTAGIRRKGKVFKKVEKFSIIKALRSLDRCDIALIVIDAKEGVADQDASIAGYAYERGCGCIIVLNKWDLIEKDKKIIKSINDKIRDSFKFLSFAPVLTVSALTGQRVLKIFAEADKIFRQYTSRIETSKLNKIIQDAIYKNEPHLYLGKRIKFYYATQISTNPPAFACVVNFPEAIHFSYKRYLINRIREGAGLDKTPIRLFFRKRSGRK